MGLRSQKTKPRFTHDCDRCTFLGQDGKHDLYYCPQGSFPTVIARYGNDGPDYTSGMSLVDIVPALKEAKRRAIEKGLIQ